MREEENKRKKRKEREKKKRCVITVRGWGLPHPLIVPTPSEIMKWKESFLSFFLFTITLDSLATHIYGLHSPAWLGPLSRHVPQSKHLNTGAPVSTGLFLFRLVLELLYNLVVFVQ